MADFSFLSDSDDEKAVNDLLSQAIDHSVLEQVAAVNCSGFTDSVLPTNLETRFRNLKSFPAANPTSSCQATTRKCPSVSSSFTSQLPRVISPKNLLENDSKDSTMAKTVPDSQSNDEDVSISNSKVEAIKKIGAERKTRVENATSHSESSVENGVFSPSKQKTNVRASGKFKSGSFLSPSDSWDSTTEPLSPTRKTGCFWCSPKKSSRKKCKENRISGIGLDLEKNWEMNDLFLSELSTFSTKEQQKMLKKAMKEEEKISREAEKIVKWAKQASARMDVSEINDELSDNDNTK